MTAAAIVATEKDEGGAGEIVATEKEVKMTQKKPIPAHWEEQANKAAEFYEIPVAELKREVRHALTRLVAEKIAQNEIEDRQKSSSTAEAAEVSHIHESHYGKY